MIGQSLVERLLQERGAQAVRHVAIGAVTQKEFPLCCQCCLDVLPAIYVLLTPVHHSDISYFFWGGGDGEERRGEEGRGETRMLARSHAGSLVAMATHLSVRVILCSLALLWHLYPHPSGPA